MTFKKLVVGAAAAAVVAVPLAGVALADPSPSNPGTPGNVGAALSPGASIPPGRIVSGIAKRPGSVPGSIEPPGQSTRTFAPGHTS
jgi:hypothetical protein